MTSVAKSIDRRRVPVAKVDGPCSARPMEPVQTSRILPPYRSFTRRGTPTRERQRGRRRRLTARTPRDNVRGVAVARPIDALRPPLPMPVAVLSHRDRLSPGVVLGEGYLLEGVVGESVASIVYAATTR